MRIDRELKSQPNDVEVKEVVKEAPELEATLTAPRGTLSLDDVLSMRNQLKQSVEKLSKQSDDLVANGTEDFSAEKKEAEKLLNNYSREYAKRKRLCTVIIDRILEAHPGSKKDLLQEIGIKTKLL